MCDVPIRDSQCQRRVSLHFLNYHVRGNIWRASSRKQLRARTALSDSDSFVAPVGVAFNPKPNYLRTPAGPIMEKVLAHSPDADGETAPTKMVDRAVRLIQYAGFPGFPRADFSPRS